MRVKDSGEESGLSRGGVQGERKRSAWRQAEQCTSIMYKRQFTTKQEHQVNTSLGCCLKCNCSDRCEESHLLVIGSQLWQKHLISKVFKVGSRSTGINMHFPFMQQLNWWKRIVKWRRWAKCFNLSLSNFSVVQNHLPAAFKSDVMNGNKSRTCNRRATLQKLCSTTC